MEDAQIIALYIQRDEAAIAETQRKYGAFCSRIATNILSAEDAEECVNDAYHQVWLAIPPQRPTHFSAWLGRIVRNNAINLWNKNHRKKRYNGMTELLSELEESIPSPRTMEREMEDRELSACIDAWLRTLKQEDRVLFLRRYWYGMPLQDLAKEQHMSSGKLAQRMFRLRTNLRQALEKEGIIL